jgi:hypothetical protein
MFLVGSEHHKALGEKYNPSLREEGEVARWKTPENTLHKINKAPLL